MLKLIKVALIFCLVWGGGVAMTYAQNSPIATVRDASGQVTLSDGTPVKAGQAIQAGQVLATQTGAEAVLVLGLGAGNLLRIEEETTLGFEAPSKASLAQGTVLVDLQELPKGSTFQLRSPTAVATVRGTSFRMVYSPESSITLVVGISGKLEVAAFKAGAPTGNVSALNAGESVSVDAAGVVKKIHTAGRGHAKAKISSAEKAYYIASDCKPENNITTCTQEPGGEEGDSNGLEYDDFLMYLDDEVQLPLRAFLPYAESRLEIMHGGIRYKFEGIMIVCFDEIAFKTVRVKLFQAGRHKIETAATRESGETITVKSGNKYGLKTTRVGVLEGRVAVTLPWLCEGCEATKTFLVEGGECFLFQYRPLRAEDEEDEEDRRIIFDAPRKADAPL